MSDIFKILGFLYNKHLSLHTSAPWTKGKKRTEHRTDDLRKKKIGQMQIEARQHCVGSLDLGQGT